MRDAQMLAAKLRQSRENLESREEMKVKKEPLTPERKSLEPVRKEPEYSRKERLKDARESDIVVKVDNVQQNHKNMENRLIREPIDSPRKTPVDREKFNILEKSDHKAGLKSNSLERVKDSPGYENVSDMEPSPAPARFVLSLSSLNQVNNLRVYQMLYPNIYLSGWYFPPITEVK